MWYDMMICDVILLDHHLIILHHISSYPHAIIDMIWSWFVGCSTSWNHHHIQWCMHLLYVKAITVQEVMVMVIGGYISLTARQSSLLQSLGSSIIHMIYTRILSAYRGLKCQLIRNTGLGSIWSDLLYLTNGLLLFGVDWKLLSPRSCPCYNLTVAHHDKKSQSSALLSK
jgi:hypothetical protein